MLMYTTFYLYNSIKPDIEVHKVTLTTGTVTGCLAIPP